MINHNIMYNVYLTRKSQIQTLSIYEKSYYLYFGYRYNQWWASFRLVTNGYKILKLGNI